MLQSWGFLDRSYVLTIPVTRSHSRQHSTRMLPGQLGLMASETPAARRNHGSILSLSPCSESSSDGGQSLHHSRNFCPVIRD